MSGEQASFAAWLRETAQAAGFDLDSRGGAARLASAAGIDPGQLSRALRGLAVPSIEGQRGLAKAIGVPMLEMLLSSGYLRPEDIAEVIRAWQTTDTDVDYSQYTAGPREPDLPALASAYNIPADQRANFMELVEAVAALTGRLNAGDALPHIINLVALLNSTGAVVQGGTVAAAPAGYAQVTPSEDYLMRGASPTTKVEPPTGE